MSACSHVRVRVDGPADTVAATVDTLTRHLPVTPPITTPHLPQAHRPRARLPRPHHPREHPREGSLK